MKTRIFKSNLSSQCVIEYDDHNIPHSKIFTWVGLEEVEVFTTLKDISEDYFLLKYSIKDFEFNLKYVNEISEDYPDQFVEIDNRSQ